jgi:hypothetical protein
MDQGPREPTPGQLFWRRLVARSSASPTRTSGDAVRNVGQQSDQRTSLQVSAGYKGQEFLSNIDVISLHVYHR